MSAPESSPTISLGLRSSRSRRIALILLGLVLFFVSLAALLYISWPVESIQLQATLQPTLFVSP